MSTIKSSDEHLTLNADGSSKDIKLQSNGSEKVIIKSDGKVGINTSSPSAVLETKNTTDGTTFAFQATNDNDHEIVQIGAQSDGDGYLTVHGQGAATNIKALIHSDGDSYFNGGNVGIGHTSTTGSKFAICDGANSQIQFFPEISTDTNLTQHYDPTAAAYINAETRAASHSFKIGTDEKMILRSDGALHIGTANAASTDLKFKNNYVNGNMARFNNDANSNPYGIALVFDGASPDDSTRYFLICNDSSTTRFRINSDGDAQNHDNSYGSTSDERIKQDIRDSNSQWDDIKNIRIRNFKKKDDVRQYGENAWEQIGVVAQELETVSPKLIRHADPTPSDILSDSSFGTLYEEGDEIPEDKNIGDVKEINHQVKSVSYSVLYMKSIKALQEAMAKIEDLEARITALEA
jgi:hypothetical protein